MQLLCLRKSLRILLAFASFSVSGTPGAAAPEFLWARQGDTASRSEPFRVAADSEGSVFVAGFFLDRMSLGGTNLYAHGSFSGWEDMFVAKYDRDGTLLWARSAGGARSD
jgi:hypothetical protein